MRSFFSRLNFSQALLASIAGLALFIAVNLSGNVYPRFHRGEVAQQAIEQLDAMRIPILQIKELENQAFLQNSFKAALDELDTIISSAKSILNDYQVLARYNPELSGYVEQFSTSFNDWLVKERDMFQHLGDMGTATPHGIKHIIVADREMLNALNLLAKGETSIHADILDGRKAVGLAQITGLILLFYLFLVIILYHKISVHTIAAREQDLDITLHSIGDAVISTDDRGRVVRMNPIAEHLTGWSIEKAKGQRLVDVFRIEDATTGMPVTSPVDDVLENGNIVGLANHTVLIALDGNRYQIADSAAPIKDHSGIIQGVILVFHDVTASYKVQQTIQEQSSRLNMIIDSSMDAIIAANENGRILQWNAQAERVFGWTAEEMTGSLLHETIIPSRFREDHLRGIERLKLTGKSVILNQHFEISALHKDGKEFPIELSISKASANNSLLFSAFVRDLTDKKDSEQELKLAAITFESHSGIVITDSRKRILRANPAMEKMTGYSSEEMIGEYPSMLSSGNRDSSFYRRMRQQIVLTGNWSGELWNKRKDGSLYAEYLTITAVKDAAGNVTHYVGTSNDITDRKKAEEKIEKLAYYDDLTALTNRRLLLTQLEHEMFVAKSQKTFGSLLYLDLDRFKNLNDALGHSVGDELLRQVAKRLLKLVRKKDTVSRFGGDEFVVMLPAVYEDADRAGIEASLVADKIKLRLNRIFDLKGYKYHLNTSIGIVVFPEEEDKPEDVLKHADSAMYHAKDEGRNTARFYKPVMQKKADTRLQLEKDIRRALENNELNLYFQPQVTGAGTIVGAEALLRWHHPQRGMILPGEFIPLAEETGLILEIGNWVLRQATEQVSLWHDLGICPQSRSLAINVSPRQFHQASFVENVLDMINSAGVSAGCIELEITENLLMDSTGDLVKRLSVLRDHGIKIAIDDFGTGYSSLSYLKKLPLDKLKIDRSFVSDITTNSNDAAIVDTIIAMSRHLGLNVIAEGVETVEQLDFLKSKGCEVYQGYYFSKPVPAEKMVQILGNNTV